MYTSEEESIVHERDLTGLKVAVTEEENAQFLPQPLAHGASEDEHSSLKRISVKTVT